jgi:Domain of unknown function (DUF397)
MSSPEPCTWRKASGSYANGNCVEVASLPDGQIGVRDSKDPGGPVLTFTPRAWVAFLNKVSDDELAEHS